MASSIFQKPNNNIMQQAKAMMNNQQIQSVMAMLSNKGITAEQAVRSMCKQQGIDVDEFMSTIRNG